MVGRGTKETEHHNAWGVLTAVTRLASPEQHRPRREDDGIGHQNDELPRGQRAGRLRAVPDVHEEQHVDVFQVILIDSGDNLHINNLLLSPSILLLKRFFHTSAWWESAGSVSLIFFRIPMISPPLV